MATTLTKTKASPHALKYVFSSDDPGGGVVIKTRAEVVGDAGAGALRAFLAQTADADWSNLAAGDTISIYVSNKAGALSPVQADFFLLPGPVLGVSSQAPADAFVEVRFHHSVIR